MSLVSSYRRIMSMVLPTFFLFVSNLAVNGQSRLLKFSYLTVDNGLSHTDAKDIKQDKLGFIWIATLFGLDRYDGYSIKRFYNSNDPKNNAFRNRVRSIYLDEDGLIWLGTDAGVQCFNPKTENYLKLTESNSTGNLSYTKLLKYKPSKLAVIYRNQVKLFNVKNTVLSTIKLNLPAKVEFRDLVSDHFGNILLTSNQGLWVLDAKKKFRHLIVMDQWQKEISSFTKLYLDKKNNLILSYGTTVNLIALPKNDLSLINIPRKLSISQKFSYPDCSVITDVLQDKDSNYWVSTDAGLLYLSKRFSLKEVITSRSFTNSLNSNYLDKLFIDRSECLWVCTFGGGVNYCDLNAKQFYTLKHNPEQSNTLPENHIRSILEEDGRLVWIGTNSSGLSQYDFQTGLFKTFNVSNSTKLKSKVITALASDNAHNLWIGTDKGIDILNTRTYQILRPAGYEKFPNYDISALVKDCYGNMWFGSLSDSIGCIYHAKNNTYKVKFYGGGFFLFSDQSKPEILVSTYSGLNRLLIDSMGNLIKTFHYEVNSSAGSLSSNYVYPTRKQNDSIYWIGTLGGALDRLILKKDNSYKVKIFGNKYGVFNDVESVEIDNSGNIWMGGNGLECLNPKTYKLTRYDKNDGLQGNSFKVGSSFKGKDGRLYFGGINGLNYFYPDSIKANNIAAQPVITDLVVNNRRVDIGDSDVRIPDLKQGISYEHAIKLSYLQNNFVISFSAMHFANSFKCKYRYRLIGFDKDWNYTDGRTPSAAYNNLNYNDYKFLVEATNNDGLWSHDDASVAITVTPPWWRSTLAEICYCILILSGLIGVYIYQGRWYRLKGKIAIRDVEEQKREEMHHQREELYQQQLQFFTNISHEFRTPLTLILGPLENLITENKQPIFSHSYQIMYRNAKRLVNLINELMNFRKVADSAIKLQVRPVKLCQFIQDLSDEFSDLALRKDIELLLIKPNEELSNWFDLQIVEKILLNLLNNAFKYTESGGKVVLETFFDLEQHIAAYSDEFRIINESRAGKYVYFRVADTGIGISKESIGNIFDRYYRISTNHLGSGVGLALVKSLTLLHKGDIYVFSERYVGTEIIIALPWGGENYSEVERGSNSVQLGVQLEELDNTVLSPMAVNETEVIHDHNISVLKQSILIVEDNEELRQFLKNVLEQHYFIYEAMDGQQGLYIAIDKVPDLIITDVMMPVMDGVELCRQLKEKFETSHIPVMILSAKDALEAKIEGMESGADYYFAKPLSVELLLLTIRNLFEQKLKLKLKYTKDYYADATELVKSTKDKAFMDKLLGIIDMHIEEQELDVDYLCQNLYTSRTKLYQKINSISGQSVGEFIRTARLKKAVYIMTHEDITINELIQRTGFTSGSYFARAFRKEFGESPTQFLQNLKKQSFN